MSPTPTPKVARLVTTEKPDLFVHSDYAEVAKSALRYLADHADDLYRYCDRIAFIRRDDDRRPCIKMADVHDIRMIVAEHMQPYKLTGEGRKDVALPVDCANLILSARTDIASFRPLVGITTAPLLREDGSIHTIDGYDPASRMFCDFANLPPLQIPQTPTREEAKASLNAIRETFAESPFSDRKLNRENPEATDLETTPHHDESAFLNALLLGVCRPSMQLAPAALIRAPHGNAGAGKTTLARAIAFIGFGFIPKDTLFPESMAEFEKTLLAELRKGPPVVVFDNGNNAILRSNLLDLILTSGHAQGRVLTTSNMVDLETRALLLFTGNSIGISADDIRRIPIVVNLDARTENPERRPVANKEFLDAIIKPRRAEFLGHLLTIWRWGRQQQGKEIGQGDHLASFDQYCRWVRDPLLALGCKDPVSRIDELKMTDTDREYQMTVLNEWWRLYRLSPCSPEYKFRTKWVTANGLHADICLLIDPNHASNRRARVISTLARWRGVRVGGFVLNSNAGNKGHWSATRYWLTRETPLSNDDKQQDEEGDHV